MPHHANSPNPADTDTALMARVRDGDADAFAQLVDRWKQPVYHFILRSLPDETEAEDLTQSVFVQIWKSAPRYAATAKFSTFLFTVARNLCLNEIRRRARHPAESLDAAHATEESSPYEQLEDSRQATADLAAQSTELYAKVQDAIDALPEKQRSALTLCREGELSYEEIAEVLDCSVQATKSLIHRARETLKARLKPYLRTGAWRE
jgi:RNA polymerase sigma-70 factor (ECF subfamily)